MALTPQGKIVYATAQQLDATIGQMHERLDQSTGEISGELRIGLVRKHLVQPAITTCLANHPQLRIHFTAKDGPLDLPRPTRIAIHVGSDHSGLMREQKLLTNHVCLANARTSGKISALNHPSELTNMPTVGYISSIETWRYFEGSDVNSVTVNPILKVTDGNLLADAVCAGVGIGYLSEFAIQEELASGKLVRVLPNWKLPPYDPVTVFCAKTSYGSQRVAAFLGHLQSATQKTK